jgi:hypothetical protein
MAFVQKYIYTPAEGTQLITISQWCLSSLSGAERDELITILKSRAGIVTACETLGYLVTSFNGYDVYIWDTEAHATEMLPGNAVYSQYHARYLEETGTTFQLVTEHV